MGWFPDDKGKGVAARGPMSGWTEQSEGRDEGAKRRSLFHCRPEPGYNN